MGLFDNLFKTKTSAAPEEIAETKGKPAGAGPVVDSAKAGESAVPAFPKPPVIPAPSAFAPRSLGHVVTPGRAPRGGNAEPRHHGDANEAPKGHEIVITLGDILDRLPAQVITPGPHDPHRELRFRLGDLSADIARGRAAIPLSEIAAQCPDLFRCQIVPEDDVMVRLPLQKLVDQIGPLPSRIASAPLPAPPSQPQVLPPPVAGEATITLRLAAILRTCPREIILGELPAIAESDAVKFPFAPIERQLPNGRVDVSSGRFVAALPPHLQERFRPIEGVRVPLPLDEIFLNLPDQKTVATAPPVKPAAAAPAFVFAPVNVEQPRANLLPAPEAPLEPPSPEPPPAETPKVEPPVAKAPQVGRPEPELSEAEPPKVETPIAESVVSTAAAPTPVTEVSQAEIDDLRARIAALRAEIGVVVATPVEISPSPTPSSIAPPVVLPPPARFAPPPVAAEVQPAAVVPSAELPIFRSPLVPPVVVSAAAIEEAKVVPPKIEPPSPVMLPVRKPAPPVVRPHVAPPRLFSAAESVPLAEVHGPAPLPASPTEPDTSAQEPPPAPTPSPLPPLSLDLEPARAALALAGPLTLGQFGEYLASLPGLHACVLDARHESAAAGTFPAGLDAAAVRERCAPLAATLTGGDTQHLTLFAEPACISFFARGEARLAVLHRARVFLPGVGEKLHAAIEALARA